MIQDMAAEAFRIQSFIRKTVQRAGAKGVILGLSGGVDSAVVGILCVRALGKENVEVVLMPSRTTTSRDMADARRLAREWKVRTHETPIDGIVGAVLSATKKKASKLALANVQARVRMTVLYYFANTTGKLVAGTGDRSEIELGYFTKFGDGGVDFLPIGHLFKTEVRELGRFLKIPSGIVKKPSSPGLWKGHLATDELPADYEVLDVFLEEVMDSGKTLSEAADRAGLTKTAASKAMLMTKRSSHKRNLPPVLPRNRKTG